MRRTSLVAALVAMGLSALPAAAQDYDMQPEEPAYQWNSARPDSRGPAGVTMDKLYQAGDFSMAYRFNQLNEEDYYLGTTQVLVTDLLRDFPTVALTTNRWRHELELGLGLSDGFSLLATVPFVFTRTDNLTDDLTFYQTEAEGLGDISAAMLLGVYNEGAVRFHLSAGASFPTGSLEQTGVTPLSGGEAQLPYSMQNGSGTVDVTPGATVQVQNEHGTVGFQGHYTVRLGTNDRDYKFGNVFLGNIWAAVKASDVISASVRFQYQHTSDLKGQDMALDPFQEPSANPLFQSGTRVALPLGLNVAFPAGSSLAGHRITGEYVLPIHNDNKGIMIGANWGLQLRWEAVF